MISPLDRRFFQVTGIAIVFLYLVILAGSVVRATGSGMGCPDWPKCFGHLIPPTDPAELDFHANRLYKEGEMVIVHDTLWKATSAFTSSGTFDRAKWTIVQLNAKFVAQQTWTEYINRQIGAINGVCMLLLVVLALLRIRRDWPTFAIIIVGMGVMGFVIWLGAVVVRTNLAPQKITFHMMSSVVILSAVIWARARVGLQSGLLRAQETGKKIKWLLIGALVLTLAQILLGTQVRQQVDTINANMDGHSRETWIEQLDHLYPVHQVTAVALVIVNLLLFWWLYKLRPEKRTRILSFALLLIVLGEYGAGVLLHRFALPSFIQPVHLILAMILFGVQFSILARLRPPLPAVATAQPDKN